ncbi:MAG: hypothetical protein CVU68_07115 [Deltaproteobacteria bacterium HGW-Deltaproteobacteria-3]|jgi:hypothetical protein|nr:MAG: hypothetical protein CVU68_07115 [Deltaproteobacteria bacterium HGW-Deltaproteobacteria-3]
MNVYSFIFRPIIEGDGPGVKAKVFSEVKKDFLRQAQGIVGRRRERLGCMRAGEGFLSPFWLFR